MCAPLFAQNVEIIWVNGMHSPVLILKKSIWFEFEMRRKLVHERPIFRCKRQLGLRKALDENVPPTFSITIRTRIIKFKNPTGGTWIETTESPRRDLKAQYATQARHLFAIYIFVGFAAT